jgi:hypothetical protein
MPVGPGKYDEAATLVRHATDAEAVVLIVFNGEYGSGFSVQTVGADITKALPAILRSTADQIEQSLGEAR